MPWPPYPVPNDAIDGWVKQLCTAIHHHAQIMAETTKQNVDRIENAAAEMTKAVEDVREIVRQEVERG